MEREESAELLPFFSSRESALISRLILCGFAFQEKLFGAFLIAESPGLRLEERHLRVVFSMLEELSSPLFFAARRDGLGEIPKASFSGKNDFAANLGDNPLQILTLEAHPLVEKIREYSPDLDEYRTFQDIARVAATVLGGGPLLASPEKKRILFIPEVGKTDVETTIHRLSSVIRKFFGELRDIPAVEIRRAAFVPEKSSPQTFVASLLAL